MSDLSDRISDELRELQRVRDELRLKIHLGAAEAREIWEKTEHRLGELEGRVKQISHQAEEPLQDVGAALRLLLDEIRDGYRRIRDAL